MRTRRAAKLGAVAIMVAGFSLAVGGRFMPVEHGAALAAEKAAGASIMAGMSTPAAMPLGLPSQDSAKAVLNASLPRHHPQWLDVPMGATKIRVFVIYPDLAGTAPVAVI